MALIGLNQTNANTNASTNAKDDSADSPATGQNIIDVNEQDFMQEVINESMNRPVIVDFHAEWCGPCKQLGPLLEKHVNASNGALRLAKIDIDKNQMIAGQMQIQSIPMVYVFYQGQPVDGFAGAQAESQIKALIDKWVNESGGGSGGDKQGYLDKAKELYEMGEKDQAQELVVALFSDDPSYLPARILLIEWLMEAGDMETPSHLIEDCPDDQKNDSEFKRIKTKFDLMQAGDVDDGEVKALQSRLDENSKDHEARFELATIYAARTDYEQAMDLLLTIIEDEQDWQEDRAKKQLFTLFEAAGQGDKITIRARRRLSSLLFS